MSSRCPGALFIICIAPLFGRRVCVPTSAPVRKEYSVDAYRSPIGKKSLCVPFFIVWESVLACRAKPSWVLVSFTAAFHLAGVWGIPQILVGRSFAARPFWGDPWDKQCSLQQSVNYHGRNLSSSPMKWSPRIECVPRKQRNWRSDWARRLGKAFEACH